MDFIKPISGFGRNKGDTITLVRANKITQQSTSELSETERIPTSDFSISTAGITVTEYGRAVVWSHKSSILSKFDPEDPIQEALTDNMTKSLDLSGAAIMKTTYLKYVPTSLSGGTFDEAVADATTTALVNLTKAHLGAIRDGMKSTYVIPPYEGQDYIGLLSTKAMRGILTDEEFVAWAQYLRNGATLYNSEVGKIESIRCVEVADTDCLSASLGTGSVLGEGIVFGKDFAAVVETETPEIKLQINMGQDFGRRKAAAWYGIMGFGLKFASTATAGLVKGIHIESA